MQYYAMNVVKVEFEDVDKMKIKTEVFCYQNCYFQKHSKCTKFAITIGAVTGKCTDKKIRS